MKVPVIWPDEYTYLFIAKYFGGETIIQGMPKTDITGSFGYSLLISPIFRFFDNPESIYRGVIIINGFFASTLYIALFLFLKRIAGSNDRIALIISLAVCMFPAYLLQSNNAYTDSLTPSYFLFGIVAFQNMVKKKDLGSVVIFAVLAGFMNWIHIRMLPFSLISMTIIVFMFYKKQIKPIDAILGFGIIAVFILFGVIISDHISLVIHGSLSDKDRVLSSLINITEIVLIFAVLFILIFTLLKRKYSYLIFTASGILTGILFSENPLSFLIILIASIGVYSYKRKHTNLWTELLIGIFLSIVIAFLTYFAVPALSYFTIVLDRIRIWGINLSGVAYYAVFSTFLFALIGLVSIFYSGYSSFRKSGLPEEPENIKDFSTIRAPYFDFSDMWSKPDIMSLFFMIFTALGMVAITIFPKELTVQHYRADHLFYGRYIEVILAGFYAIGLYKIAKGTAREYLLISIISIFVFFSMSFLMMYVYGNVIASELSFKSVISFFPLRAVLGDINLFVFSLFAISGAVFFSIFNRFKPFLGNLILCIGLLLISLFTYYYVDYYYQTDKQERNKIIKYLENEFSDIDTINYDLSIYNEKSQNGLHYIWMMPEKHFNFFIPKQNKTISNLTIGSGNYGISVQKDALLYGIEHDGNDVLWIEEGALQTKFKYRIPNYFNIELDKDYVKGVFRSAFYKEDWINGK